MKKIIFVLSLILIISSGTQARTLHHIRHAAYPEKIRVVFDFDNEFNYEVHEQKDKIEIILTEVDAGYDIPSYVELNDLAIPYIGVEKEEENLKITIPLLEPVEHNIFSLSTPPRLVVDFGREFVNVIYGGIVSQGVEHYKVRQGTAKGIVTANVLMIDLEQAHVKPALARTFKDNGLETLIHLLFPWTKAESEKRHFALDKVANIAEYNNAIAAINGTFFARDGTPLGALIIDEELLSYPIHDRSSFFLDRLNQPYIDNVAIAGSFTLQNQKDYKIKGINQARGANEIIMYTPAWGKRTGTDMDGLEVVIREFTITEINTGNSKIPEDGYVLSTYGVDVEPLRQVVKRWEQVAVNFRLIPFSTSPKEIKHLISGGPRLLKRGEVYVSKYQEKFQPDVAQRRAARTAIGITAKNELLFVTVDGRRRSKKRGPISLGLTLEELAKLMLDLGAVEALNLDGGGSSTMVIVNKVVNQPTSQYQRRVSNALLVFPGP